MSDPAPTNKPSAAAHPGKAWPGAFKAFSQSFERIQKNPAPALIFVGVYVVFHILTLLVVGHAARMNYEAITSLIFLLALPIYGLAIADGKRIGVRKFLAFDAKKYFSLLGAGILAGLIIGFSMLLLIIPIIWTLAWFFVTGYAVVDKGLGPIQALKESKRLAKDHKGKIWGVVGASLLFAIAAGIIATIPIVGVVGAAFLTPLVAGVNAQLYRWLQKQPAPKA